MKIKKIITTNYYALILIAFLAFSHQLKAQILTINPGDDFNTIINAASTGTIIEFSPGTYNGYF